MARYFILSAIIREANAVDIIESRRQSTSIREMQIINRNKNFVECYRLSEELVSQVMEDIKVLVKKPQRRRRGLTARVKLLCALSFFATGSYQRICGKHINSFVSQPSASRSIHEVIEALSHPSIVKKYIRFPQNSEERLRLKTRFYEKFSIPVVIGCVDGTFVTMVRPTCHEERYYCRKGYHARNVQMFTDADLNIIHVDATYGGATHDSLIFNNCIIRDHLEQLVQTGESVYLLGDSGYPQRQYLMVPVPNADEGTPEHHYN
ncbi:unnamed protein product [Colias eurytheme]|nr:unnamed protein product [Colias eurytheme]